MKKLTNDFKDILIYTFTSGATILLFLILLVLSDYNFWFALLGSVVIGTVFYYQKGNNDTGPRKNSAKLKKLTPEKEAFYHSKGLSKEETNFFRETMNTAKYQIVKIEKNLDSTGKLRAIEHRNNTVRVAKSLFKEITKDPQRLHVVDKFLYVHLPSLMELTDKYVEIDRHEAKSKSTYDILDKSAETIDEMCQLIVEDYVRFMSEDIEDMELEVELAKRTINKDNGTNNSIEEEEV